MLTKEQNELLCKTDPGTPCGEMMRRYWQPVGLSSEEEAGGPLQALISIVSDANLDTQEDR